MYKAPNSSINFAPPAPDSLTRAGYFKRYILNMRQRLHFPSRTPMVILAAITTIFTGCASEPKVRGATLSGAEVSAIIDAVGRIQDNCSVKISSIRPCPGKSSIADNAQCFVASSEDGNGNSWKFRWYVVDLKNINATVRSIGIGPLHDIDKDTIEVVSGCPR